MEEKILAEYLLRKGFEFDYIDDTTADNIYEVIKDENVIAVYEVNIQKYTDPRELFKGENINKLNELGDIKDVYFNIGKLKQYVSDLISIDGSEGDMFILNELKNAKTVDDILKVADLDSSNDGKLVLLKGEPHLINKQSVYDDLFDFGGEVYKGYVIKELEV